MNTEKYRVIYDITPEMNPDLKVWPGDTPLSREVLLDMKNGHNFTLSTLRSTVHIGAHADAPNHYGLNSLDIGSRDLNYYVGKCQVISVSVENYSRIYPHDVKVEIDAKRVLFKTLTFPDPYNFTNDFAALSPELIEFLHEHGVILVGIDTPSVDVFSSKDLPSHLAILKNDMAILEGIRLDDVSDGIYELIALPLKLKDFDASPVRAILRDYLE